MHAEERVWLRGNPLPGRLVAAAFGLTGALLVSVAILWPLGGASRLMVGGLATLLFLLGGGWLMVAMRPRVASGCRRILVRLAPLRMEVVPLEAVECFFLGSRLEPPAPGDDSTGGNRVRTLVMRIAERSTDFHARPTLPAWGTWKDGSVVFEGRWCEPLSVDLVRRLNRDLTAAKRAAVPIERTTLRGPAEAVR